LFAPITAIPIVIARLMWEMASVAAFAWACVTTVKLAGCRASTTAVAAVVAMGLTLEPIYHSLYLGQINLFLLALVLTDVWRVSRGRHAGISVGLAAAVKLTPAIFVILFLLTRRTRAASTAAGTFVLCG
jgi:alpha-1,2-mannosyltransferase